MEEFRYEHSQTQLEVVILTIATKQATFWAIFEIDKNREICIVWQN